MFQENGSEIVDLTFQRGGSVDLLSGLAGGLGSGTYQVGVSYALGNLLVTDMNWSV